MTRRATRAVLSLSLLGLFLAPGPQPPSVTSRQDTVAAAAVQLVSAGGSIASDPVLVRTDLGVSTRGWSTESPDGGAGADLSGDLWDAYTLAVAVAPPACHVSVSLLAAVGQVETGDLTGLRLDAGHRAVPKIVGPVIRAAGSRRVRDTDAGEWDDDSAWDHALGPMQITPAAWRQVGVDLDGDGVRDPQDIYDAAGAAMGYLCAGGRDLASAADLREAVLAYNHSGAFLASVLAWKTAFELRQLAGVAAPHLDAWSLTPVTPLVRQSPRVAARARAARVGQALLPLEKRPSGLGDAPTAPVTRPPDAVPADPGPGTRSEAEPPAPAEVPVPAPPSEPSPQQVPLPAVHAPPPPAEPTEPTEPVSEPPASPAAEPEPLPPCPEPPLTEPGQVPATDAPVVDDTCLPVLDPAAGDEAPPAPEAVSP